MEKNLERAHSEYQQRLDSLSRRKREYGAGNVTNKLNSDSSSKSPTMRKLQFFQSGNAVQMPHVESFQQVGRFNAVLFSEVLDKSAILAKMFEIRLQHFSLLRHL